MNFLPRLLRRWQKSTCSLRTVSSDQNTNESGKRSWRKTSEERGEWTSNLKLFSSEKQHWGLMRVIQAPVDLRPEAISRWWKRKKENKEIFDQRFISQRHEILGNDLAAAHFILFRGGKVKFCHEENWYIGKEHNLPSRYTSTYNLEAIDASKVNIYYEGLFNFVSLHHLKWLSFRDCVYIDDWCLDYISGELQSLEYLDLCNCKNVTENGLACLYRLRKLKLLNVTNIPQSNSFHLTCLLLEDAVPGLKVEGVKYIKM